MEVWVDGLYSFTRIRNNNDLRHFGAGLTIEKLKKWGFDSDQIWVVSSPLKIIIKTKSKRLSYLFGPPYITDLASVPKRLRWAIDNDDIYLIAPALVHDYNFATHAKSFQKSNALFRQMIRAVGGSWFKAFITWAAVASPFGWGVYRRKRGELSDYLKETCEVVGVWQNRTSTTGNGEK